MIAPTDLSGSVPVRYGDMNAPVLPMALAAEWPVVRISVVRISAVETQVTQLPIISNALVKNARTVRVWLEADPADMDRKKRSVPPPM